VPLGDSPQSGPAGAWLTVVEFIDFDCPYTQRAYFTIGQLQESYGEDVRLVFKHFPLLKHERALPAAIAVECASALGGFWSMQAAVLNYEAVSEEGLLRFADMLLGPERLAEWQDCRASSEPRARIDADVELGRALGVPGTPTLFVNGRMLNGALSLGEYQSIFDEELDKARKSGVASEDYYEQVVLGVAPSAGQTE